MDSPAVLAFDVGGTRIKAGIVVGGTVHETRIIPTDARDSADGIIATIAHLGASLRRDIALAAAGLCIRGVVDTAHGTILTVNEPLAALIGIPLQARLAAALALPTVLDNDARMFALGEQRYGAGQGAANVVVLTLGTGVGTGVISDGKPLYGRRGSLGILGGHITVQRDGEICNCGNIGCLETLVSAPALVRAARRAAAQGKATSLLADHLDPPQLFAAASAGDPLARQVIADFTTALGSGIVSLIHVYDPEAVIVGGGLAHAADRFLPAVQAYVDAHTWAIPPEQVRIIPARYNDTAALLGVATLATKHITTEERIFP